MKLLVRILAMFVVFAGLTAASISSSPSPISTSQFGATVSGVGPMWPGPPCPTCNGGGENNGPGGLRANAR